VTREVKIKYLEPDIFYLGNKVNKYNHLTEAALRILARKPFRI